VTNRFKPAEWVRVVPPERRGLFQTPYAEPASIVARETGGDLQECMACGQLREGDPARFRPEVDRALLQMGWYKGRDLHEWVDEWLALARTPDMDREDPEDFAPYRPSTAALAVLNEFGALGFAGGAPGISAAKTQFRVYPGRREDDLAQLGALDGFQHLERVDAAEHVVQHIARDADHGDADGNSQPVQDLLLAQNRNRPAYGFQHLVPRLAFRVPCSRGQLVARFGPEWNS